MIDDMGLEQLADIRRALTHALNAADALDQLEAARATHDTPARSQLTSKLADAIDDLDSLVHRHKQNDRTRRRIRPYLTDAGALPADTEIVKRPTAPDWRVRPGEEPLTKFGTCSPVGAPGMPPVSTGMPWHAGMLAEAVKRANDVLRIRDFDDWPVLSDPELFPHPAELHRRAVAEGATGIEADQMIGSVEVHSDTEKRRLHFFIGDGAAIAALRSVRDSVTPPTVDMQQLIESRVRYGSDAQYANRLAAEYRRDHADVRQRLADAVRPERKPTPTPKDIAERRVREGRKP